MSQIFTATVDGEPVVVGSGEGKTNTVGLKGVGDSGVVGEASTWCGVIGLSKSTTGGFGVYGKNTAGGTGVVGESDGWMGVYGKSASTTGGAGVMGEAVGPGIIGKSQTWMGVYGETTSTTGGAGVWGEHKRDGAGVVGKSGGGVGVFGVSERHEGIHAETRSAGTAAIAAYNLNPAGTGAAIFAKKEGAAGHAGFFDGNVFVSGEIMSGKDIICQGADCAEEFDIAAGAEAEPGTVMVVGPAGTLSVSSLAYDRRVAGVISGAGAYRPAMILDRQVDGAAGRKSLALIGKVYCKADASNGPIEIGDLLTTSSTPGHAMRAADPLRAFGAVIGKALGRLEEGCGLVPILIALQ